MSDTLFKWLPLLGSIATMLLGVGYAKAEADVLKQAHQAAVQKIERLEIEQADMGKQGARHGEALETLKQDSKEINRKLDRVLERLPR